MKGLLCLIALTFALGYCYAQENCKLKKDKEGIKVYTCDENESKFKSLRAEFLLPGVTIDQLKNTLLDGDLYKSWQYNMIESRVLEKINDHEAIVRSVIDAPWPVTNREMIVQVSITGDLEQNVLTVRANAIKSEYPMNDALVRVPFSEARWEVAIVNNKDLSIQYFLRIDPGGSVPTWLVNMAMAEGPYVTFKNLREKLMK